MQSASFLNHPIYVEGISTVNLRHPNTHPAPFSKRHKRLPHLLLVASQRPAFRNELLGMRKVVFVQMEDPGGHRDGEACGDGVALELGATLRDDARKTRDDAEG